MDTSPQIKPIKRHTAYLSDGKITLSGVTAVCSYDDKEIALKLSNGNALLTGSGFEIDKLDLENGTLEARGNVSCLKYTGKTAGKASLLSKLFK